MNKHFLWIMLLFAAALPADENAWQELAQEALQNNTDIQAAYERYRAATQDPQIAGQYPDPQLMWTHWLEPVETRLGPQENVLNLTQRVPFPGKLSAREQQAAGAAEASLQNLLKTKRDVLAKLKTLVWELNRVQESIAVLEEFKMHFKPFASSVSASYRSGRTSQARLLQIHVEEQLFDTKIALLVNEKSALTAKINALLNRPADATLAKGLTPTRIDSLENSDFWLARADSLRQEQRMLQANISQTEYKVKEARRNYWPDFMIGATWAQIGESVMPNPESGRDALAINAGISIPLWQAPRDASVEKALRSGSAYQSSLSGDKTMVAGQIRDLLFRFRTLKEQVQLYTEQLVPQSRESLTSQMLGYESGQISFVEMMQSHQLWHRMELERIRLMTEQQKVAVELERLTGGDPRLINMNGE